MNLPSGANFEMRPIAVGRILVEELRVVRLGDEDAAVGSDEHVVRLGELRRRIARFARRAERQQELALRCELHHRVALRFPFGKFRELLRRRRARVGNPDVALLVDVHAVRPEDLSRAEARHDLAVRIELHDRIDIGSDARIRAAAIAGPDVLAVDIDVHGADRSPVAVVGQRAPVADGLVGVGQVVDRRDFGVLGRTRRSTRRRGRLWRARLRRGGLLRREPGGAHYGETDNGHRALHDESSPGTVLIEIAAISLRYNRATLE